MSSEPEHDQKTVITTTSSPVSRKSRASTTIVSSSSSSSSSFDPPPPAYELQRSENTIMNSQQPGGDGDSYAPSAVDSESYLDLHEAARLQNAQHYTHYNNDDNSTVMTANYASAYNQNQNNHSADATDTVHEMHLALLYLLSNPEEFQKTLAAQPERGATTLAQWNAEYDNESLMTAETEYTNPKNQVKVPSSPGPPASTPLPFVVFADDAEVVLPQAHTASQLFGIERLEGIELEAAAGIPALSQLFLRWLALMPGGDHLNIIDPPGLTVMRIAGGRYRVTAAHRVVWTWMNEFAQLTDPRTSAPKQQSSSSFDSIRSPSRNNDGAVDLLQVGDLVTMTIVDVFETDSHGKLLSYCPTFDNRAIYKTNPTGEAIRKSSSKVMAMVNRAQQSKLALLVRQQAGVFAKTLKTKVDHAVRGNTDGSSPEVKRQNSHDESDDHYSTSQVPPKQKQQYLLSSQSLQAPSSPQSTKPSAAGTSLYMADDDLEKHEV